MKFHNYLYCEIYKKLLYYVCTNKESANIEKGGAKIATLLTSGISYQSLSASRIEKIHFI